MDKVIRAYVGLDVHKESIAVAVTLPRFDVHQATQP